MSWKTAGTVTLIGVVAAGLLSLTLHDSVGTRIELIAVAGGAAIGTGLVGTVALRAARRRSIWVQSSIVTLTSIGAVAAGAMAAAHIMMVSSPSIAALGVVLVSSGTIGLLISLFLGAQIRSDSDSLIAATRQIGEGDLRTRLAAPATEEFAALAHELETMQSQLERSAARERKLEDARRELVAWMSHDLRTPLARIRAITEALADDLPVTRDEVRAYYRRLRLEADRLAELIDGLFELNTIAAGTLEVELERARIADILSDLVASFSVIAQARGITLRARLPAIDPEVELSPSHCERALGNLLDNALRYTDGGGCVDVEMIATSDLVDVVIDDSCGGIDPTHLRRLLAGNGASPLVGRAGKTGLGLAIAKGLIEAQGGRIAVEGTDRGCRFTVSFPVASRSAVVGTRSVSVVSHR
ncbi:MAG: HAMP domain-containing histidine kinase [Actinobacteria bacterium]|nr:MAG: HAMP domain-containing histidine kinase [Actinomycetota bacterium]